MPAKRFYTVEETAEILGISPAEVSHMREENRLRGYRDGATWKFRVEDVDQMAKQQKAPRGEPGEDDAGDLLLSEAELGPPDSGASGTVIGESGKPSPADSDLHLADSDVGLAGDSGLELAGSGSGRGELDLTLDEDLSLEDSKVPLGQQKGPGGKAQKTAPAGDSTLDLSAPDDELVLGGSGSGSDITIGGDSGISLVDPADSGLSLEEPLELSPPASEESLELGEDDMLTLDEQPVDSDSPTALKTDNDFLLTPLEEVGEEEESESGSQVIALDSEVTGEDAATMIATPAPAMAAMLDEDFGGLGIGAGPTLGAGPGATPGFPPTGPTIEGAPAGVGAAVLPEAPYSGWVVTGLVICFVFLLLTGWMMFDLMRNMWSWGGAYSINSSLMDAILNLLPY